MRNYYTQQIQRLICLLVVLEEMPRCPARKQEVIEYIRQRRYLDIHPEDLERYITQTEPRWNTDIAFRRKDGVEWGLLFNNQRDCWDLTRNGIELLKRVKAPLARKIIAHRFNGGTRRQMETSPVRDGRDWVANVLSSLTGLIPFGNISPGVETPGYGLPAFGLGRLKDPSSCAFLPAPSARPTIAHRFIGGLAESQTNQVP